MRKTYKRPRRAVCTTGSAYLPRDDFQYTRMSRGADNLTATDHPIERVIAYVDGLNVYQGLVAKGWRELLWLDFRQVAQSVLRGDQHLTEVYYFTAHRRNPPESYARQQVFNALDARGGVRRIEGAFERRKVPCMHCGRMTEVDRERATDVNLAAQMLADAAHDRCDVALLISGDSDYLSVVREVRALGKVVKVARPPARRSDSLADAATHFVDLKRSHIARAQLSNPVVTGRSTEIHCPFEWLSAHDKIAELTAGHQAIMRDVMAALPPGREQHLDSLVNALRAAERGSSSV